MIAAHHAEMAAGVWKLTFFDVLDPGAENAERDVVLLLARDRARMATDTAVVIDYEAVPQVNFPASLLVASLLIHPANSSSRVATINLTSTYQ
jgi:hypothetical protein